MWRMKQFRRQEPPKEQESFFRISLVDLCAIATGCNEVSDLHCLSPEQRRWLADKLEKLQPKEEDLFHWNDALDYLTGAPPEETSSAAKEHLLRRLRQ